MSPKRSFLVALYLLAFLVRLAWILKVQHPLHAVYSDMAGYVDRAEQLLWGLPSGEPRLLAIYPWGAHVLYAAEFAIVGRHAEIPIAVVHAALGAVPAPCMAILAARILASARAGVVAGVLVAFWYPQVAFAAFFLSEPWYSAAIAVQSVWTSGRGQGRLKRLATGLVSAIAFVVRPQFIVTWALDLARIGWSSLKRRGPIGAVRWMAWLVLPMAVFVAGSAVRLHALAGHWGLISENDEMTRIWADTDICKLQSSWTSSTDGGRYGYWFSPPSKPAQKPSDVEEFEGYIADPAILRQIRLRRLQGVSLRDRVWRKFHNVGLLFTGNLPWPESNYKDPAWRFALMRAFATTVLYAVLPLAAFGAILGRRGAPLFIAVLNGLTCIVCAAFFFGEGRYHVPYDPFFLVLAVVGVRELATRAARWFARRRVPRETRAEVPALSAHRGMR